MAASRALVPSTSRQLRRCLHTSAVCRAAETSEAGPSEKEKQSLEALKRLSRMPHYMRPSTLTNRDMALGDYYALRDNSKAGPWEKFASWWGERWISFSTRSQIGSSSGLSWPQAWLGTSVTQSLRADAAQAYMVLNASFGANALWHTIPKQVASTGLLQDLATRRDQLRQWNLNWVCEQEEDDLLGKSVIFNNKHLQILGYRAGAAPDETGEIAQVAQALVRFNTTQRLHAVHKRQPGPDQIITEPVSLGASEVSEYYVLQRFLTTPHSSWKMIKRVFPAEFAPAQTSKKQAAEELAALNTAEAIAT